MARRCTVPAAKAALERGLSARSGLSSVHIAWGLPTAAPQDLERIYVGPSEDLRRSPATSGGGVLEETYDLRLTVEVHLVDAQRAVEERYWALVGEIEDLVAADPHLGGVVSRCAVEPGSEKTFAMPDNGFLCVGPVSVGVLARVIPGQ